MVTFIECPLTDPPAKSINVPTDSALRGQIKPFAHCRALLGIQQSPHRRQSLCIPIIATKTFQCSHKYSGVGP